MSEKDGGPAFPRVEPETDTDGARIYFGMTLRDYFAAKAMGAYIDGTMKGGLIETIAKLASASRMTSDAYVAKHSYAIADAMLAERAK